MRHDDEFRGAAAGRRASTPARASANARAPAAEDAREGGAEANHRTRASASRLTPLHDHPRCGGAGEATDDTRASANTSTPLPNDPGESRLTEATPTARESAADGPPRPSDDSRAGEASLRSRASAKASTPLPTDPGDSRAGEAAPLPRASAILAAPLPTDPRCGEGGEARNVARESAIDAAPLPTDPGGDAGRTPAIQRSRNSASRQAPASDEPAPAAAGEEVQHPYGSQHLPDLFADPTVLAIRELWRRRQGAVDARRRLQLQAQAWCRSWTGGDKTEAGKLWKAAQYLHAPPPRRAPAQHPDAADALPVLTPYLLAIEPFDAHQAAYERELRKLAKTLPIYAAATAIRGVSADTLAALTGELGDLAAYEKGVAGVWKRAGLAVIDGERQRRKADAAAALAHGYSPARRSVVWNVAAAVFKAQSGDEPGPYRAIYDARKEIEAERVPTKAHAHNRALRFMSKRLLKDLWRLSVAVRSPADG